MANDEVLKTVSETIPRKGLVTYYGIQKLVHHPDRGMIEGSNGSGRLRRIDEIKGGRKFAGTKRPSLEMKKLQVHQPLG